METQKPMAKKKKESILTDFHPEFTGGHFAEFRSFGKVNSFLKKYNELIISPIALIVFGLVYTWVYKVFGPEAGLIPFGYFTNVLAGGVIMYVGGVMSTLAMKLNFPRSYEQIFKQDNQEASKELILSVCVYFAYYGLSLLALTSML
jgi:hypothetical protein